MDITQLDTPVAIVDLDRLEANIRRLQEHLDRLGVENRPHIKTHKIPAFAQMQMEAGAVGITCQKLGEAEVMAQAGIGDILVTFNIIGEVKLKRLVRLARQNQVSVVADSAVTVSGLSAAAQEGDITLPVLVEFDSGNKRCGVGSPYEAAGLALIIDRSPGLRFDGLMTHPTSKNTAGFVRATRESLRDHGLPFRRVSGGGTPEMWDEALYEEITEHRAGTYVYGDRRTIHSGAMTLEECALKIICSVVSRPTPERAILDGGSKTLSADNPRSEGYGLILEYPEAGIYRLSEEHGMVDVSRCKRKPEIGERVTVIPNHCCLVSNLFNQMVGVRGERVEATWPVLARGLVQ